MSSTPNPRKRHRDRYNDAYRELFNETLQGAAAPFHIDEEAAAQHYGTQIGASRWSPTEKAVFFAALQRLGQDDAAGISRVIGTKTIPETQDFLLLLQDAAAKQSDAKVTLRDVPAAIEIGNGLDDRLSTAGETLAWHQEQFEASEEKARYGDYWLITSEITSSMGNTSGDLRRELSPSTEPGTPRKGPQIAR
jgi:RNA polymerase I-specific transcription initiation factor RRN5